MASGCFTSFCAVARHIPTVRQLELADCGAACLAMVFAYHRAGAPALNELRELTGTGRDGVDALGLVEAARRFGLEARGVRADIDDLRFLPRASILHWEFDHFVVFDRLAKGSVQIIDPAIGRTRVPLDRFRRSYTGAAVVFEATGAPPSSARMSHGVFRYMRPVLREAALARRIVIASVLLRLAAVAAPLLVAVLVNRVFPRNDHDLLAVVGVAMLAMVGYHFATSFVRAHLLLRLRTHLDMQMTLGFVRHLVDLPYAFFLRRSAGDLMMRLSSNSMVREILTTGALSALLDGALVALYLVLIFAISPPMGGLVLVLGAGQVAMLVLVRERNQRLTALGLQTEARSQSYVYELLAGIQALKAAGAEHRAVRHWSDLFVDEMNVAIERGRLSALLDSVMGVLAQGSPLAVLLLGANQVLDGDLRLGTMLALSALATGFFGPLAALVTTGLQVQLLGSYIERINDVMDTPGEQADCAVRAAPRLTGHIVAETLTFQYSPKNPLAVDNLSFEVAAGGTVAIVGRSGSGKSTLAHLLLGLYLPTSGQVLFDGEDLADLDVGTVRRQIGIVTQDAYIFGTTIRENISLMDPTVAMDSVMEAADVACIHDQIAAMPMGYDTVLVDGGASVSGGERQRIALARAVVRKPAVLLLDEATSAVDALTERRIYENISRLSCTRIVIAHRLSTISHADLIVVMDDGRAVAKGTHEDLIERGTAYAALVAAQREGPRPKE